MSISAGPYSKDIWLSDGTASRSTGVLVLLSPLVIDENVSLNRYEIINNTSMEKLSLTVCHAI